MKGVHFPSYQYLNLRSASWPHNKPIPANLSYPLHCLIPYFYVPKTTPAPHIFTPSPPTPHVPFSLYPHPQQPLQKSPTPPIKPATSHLPTGNIYIYLHISSYPGLGIPNSRVFIHIRTTLPMYTHPCTGHTYVHMHVHDVRGVGKARLVNVPQSWCVLG